MLDKMAYGKGLDFDTRTLTWKGIVDYGGELSIMVPNGLADHILVFVFRPYLAIWIQPVIQSHFENLNHIYMKESFEVCCDKISESHTIPLFCEEHRDYNLKYLVIEYVKVSFHLESKRLRKLLVLPSKTEVKTNF